MKTPKTPIINLFVLPALIAVLNLIPRGRVTAQTFTALYSFMSSSTNSSGTYTNSDGANPYGGLILSSNALYGTAQYGGSSGYGTVFKVSTDGTGFATLYSFTYPYPTNPDGGWPQAGLILSGNNLYGTTTIGGSTGQGTVFSIKTDGKGFTNLDNFAGYPGDGGYPEAGLILSGATLYGTASHGGSSAAGTVFALNANGRGFTNLYSFNGGSDGANPQARLTLSGSTLYGSASGGGSPVWGTLFALSTNGTGFTNLHSFTGGIYGTGGAIPNDLILSGTTLYGTTIRGGISSYGTVFAVNTDGTGFTTLHSFTALISNTNSDGALPLSGLILSGNTLYGTASGGGSSGSGTVFALHTNGTGFKTLHSFAPSSTNSSGIYTNGGGANPSAGLILSGNTLYGTTGNGGSSGNGTVFSISFPPPQLTITPSETNVILSWPTNVAGFDYSGYTLQSAPALTGPFTNLPAATSPYTNPITGPQQFFRLSQ